MKAIQYKGWFVESKSAEVENWLNEKHTEGLDFVFKTAAGFSLFNEITPNSENPFKVIKCEDPFVEYGEAPVERFLNEWTEKGYKFIYRTPAGFTVFKKIL